MPFIEKTFIIITFKAQDPIQDYTVYSAFCFPKSLLV